MSAASAVRPTHNRSEILETVLAYNALTEDQSLLTPAELRLALILVRRGAHRQDVSVSAENWKRWTGLDPKSRDLAIRGLTKKCFRVTGRGDKARFRFEFDEWKAFVRQADRTSRPHVQQKRVPAKPNQMIHPECREQGCFLARQTEDANLVSIDAATGNRKQVSNFAIVSPVTPGLSGSSDPGNCCDDPSGQTKQMEDVCEKTGQDICSTKNSTTQPNAVSVKATRTTTQTRKTKTTQIPTIATTTPANRMKNADYMSPISAAGQQAAASSPAPSTAKSVRTPRSEKPSVATQNRKPVSNFPISSPVAQFHATVAELWPFTMSAMFERSPTAGPEFLCRLLAAVQVKTPEIADSDLATALRAATKKTQHSEGLWLKTVPVAIENLKREREKQAGIKKREEQQERERYLKFISDLPDDDPEKAALLKAAQNTSN
jgi:hypothetical protein